MNYYLLTYLLIFRLNLSNDGSKNHLALSQNTQKNVLSDLNIIYSYTVHVRFVRT